jgi:HK97 gp10 family phage protein
MAVEFGMNVEGVEEFQRALDRLPRLMHTAVERALDRVGADIHMDARRMCPLRTGRLRDSIYHKVEHWVLTVGARAPYAVYVELGTRYMEPRYFLIEAFHLNFPKLEQVLKWALDAALKAAGTGT